MTNNKARQVNNPIIKQLLDETTTEELAKIDTAMTNNKQQTEINAVEYLDKVNQFAKENNTGKPKQQTAIEWLEQEMLKPNLSMKEILEQAKEMEKEQQEKLSASWAKSREQTREIAMHIGFAKGFMSGLECHEDYYEELNRTQLDEDEFTRNYITDIFEETQGGTNESN